MEKITNTTLFRYVGSLGVGGESVIFHEVDVLSHGRDAPTVSSGCVVK